MSQLKTNSIVDASGGNTTTINGYTPTLSNMAGRNRILNGGMVIDQRNAGASVTNVAAAGTYTLDRWKYYGTSASKFTVQQNAGSVTPPVGFTNYLGITSLSANSPAAGDEYLIAQYVEGFNTADLAWGTANAATVTLSFWVRSSLTGSFSGAVKNSASNRTYPFSYTVSSANTWTNISVTIPGDTTGTWLTTNGIGISILWNIGTGSTYLTAGGAWTSTFSDGVTGSVNVLGTNGATFYITGVQLEAGSVATPFERRPYGTELALCQRYYEAYVNTPYTATRPSSTSGNGFYTVSYYVPKRATPTATVSTGSVNTINVDRVRLVGATTLSGYQSETVDAVITISAEL